MEQEQLFTLKEFTQMSRVSKYTLHYYDSIGLLAPAARGENGYRYYSTKQLSVINVIRTFQDLGMSLEEIKDLKDRRSPEGVDAAFTQQVQEINQRIEAWSNARDLLETYQQIIRSVADVDEAVITIQSLPEEAIMLGEPNDYKKSSNAYEALYVFYQKMTEKDPNVNLNYPVWGVFSAERIKKGDWKWPNSYYFYNPKGEDRRPAGLYAVGYTRGGYGQSDALFKKLLEYIEENNYEITGDAYEEYPLDELSIVDDENYLMRIMIQVSKK